MPSSPSLRLSIMNNTGGRVEVLLLLSLLLVLLLQFPDGTFGQTIPPSCQRLTQEEQFYFPNDCVSKCGAQGDTFDMKRSRNVNGNIKCFCLNSDIPICTDDPMCADLSIFPGTVYENCINNVCSSSDNGNNFMVTDEIEYNFEDNAANKNQTHYKVSCSCDGGVTTECGIDYILFSDLTYLPSCTKTNDKTPGKINNLDINSKQDCTDYCQTAHNSNGAFAVDDSEWFIYNEGSSLPPGQQDYYHSCGCLDKNRNGNIAIACDDTTANYNDGSGLGTKNCYESVGVNTVDCSTPDDESSATTMMMMTTTTIMTTMIGGMWLVF